MSDQGKTPPKYEMPSGGGNSSGGRQPNSSPHLDQKELEELARNLKDLGIVIAQEAGKGINELAGVVQGKVSQAAANAGKAASQQAKRAAAATPRIPENYQKQIKSLQVSTGSALEDGFGYLFGSICAVSTAVLGVVSLLVLFAPSLSIFLALLAAAFGLVSWKLFGRPLRKKRLRRYREAMGDETAVPIRRLAEAVCRKEAFVKKDLTKMIRQGILADGYVDDEDGLFFISAAKYRAYQRKQEAEQRVQSAPESYKEKWKELLLQMEDFLYLLDEHIETTKNEEEICSRLKNLRQTASDILVWSKAHPEGMNQIRRLTTYYMPTSLKLLRTYDEVKHQQGDTAQSIRQDIVGMLDDLNAGFDTMRTSLLANTAMDISGEISAMQTMLAQDGLAESKFQEQRSNGIQ